MTEGSYKMKSLLGGERKSAFRRYRDLVYGEQGLGRVLWGELLVLMIGSLPGALGLFLRSKLYPTLFREVGRGVIFGRNLNASTYHTRYGWAKVWCWMMGQ